MKQNRNPPTAREILDKQLDYIICSFNFRCCAKSLNDLGWMRDRDPEELEMNLRSSALDQMREARDGVIKWLDTDETFLTYKIDRYPLLALATICRDTEANTWAKMDLIGYVESSIEDGETCSAEPEDA